MGTFYVSSVDGSDADNGSTWALAKATVAGALAICTDATNIIYVDSAHDFTAGAAITWDLPNTNTSVAIISVNRNGSTTTGHSGWQVGAKEKIGAAGAIFGIVTAARNVSFYIYGVELSCGSGVSSSSVLRFGFGTGTFVVDVEAVNCTFRSPSTNIGATSPYQIGPGLATLHKQQRYTFTDCTAYLVNNASSRGFDFLAADITFKNLTIAYEGAARPTPLFRPITPFRLEITGCDLSAFDTGNYIDVSLLTFGQVLVTNCKLHATPGVVTGTIASNGASVTLINTDSSDTKTVFGYYMSTGTLLSTQSIYRDSGFSVGGINVGWHLVTTAACNEQNPFVTPWMSGGFNTSTSPMTAAIKLIHDSATNLDDREAWMEVSYVSDASFPKGTLASTRNAQPFDGTGVDLASDADAWTGTGGFSNANKQKASKTFTPAEGSAIEGRLLVGVASKTLYIDPQLVIS